MQHLGGRPVAQRPARTRGRAVLHRPHLRVGDRPEVRPLRQVLPDQPVGVPVQAPLPGVAGGGEEEPGTERLRDAGVARELPAAVRRDRVDGRGGRRRHLHHRGGDRGRRSPVSPLQENESRRPVHKGDHRPAVAPADDRVRLPVAGPLPAPRLLRPPGDVDAVRDVAPARVPAASPVRLPAAAPQQREQPAARLVCSENQK